MCSIFYSWCFQFVYFFCFRRWRSFISLHLTCLSRLSRSPRESASRRWSEKLSPYMYQRSWQVWRNQSCFMSRGTSWINKWLIVVASVNSNTGSTSLHFHSYCSSSCPPISIFIPFNHNWDCLFSIVCSFKAFIWTVARHRMLTALRRLSTEFVFSKLSVNQYNPLKGGWIRTWFNFTHTL